MDMVECHHFVFGYGSLLCHHSRSQSFQTTPTTTTTTTTATIINVNSDDVITSERRVALPVIIKGMERVWSKRTTMMTAMGVRFQVGSSTTGVLISVSPKEIQQLDLREQGYDRLEIHASDIEKVSFLNDSSVYNGWDWIFESEDTVDKKRKRTVDMKRLRVWVYMPQKFSPPSVEYPIVQSYVDTILRGCLDVGGEDFARDFILTTIGWHPEQFHDTCHDDGGGGGGIYRREDDTNKLTITKSSPVVKTATWVDDRCHPIYARCDVIHIEKNADMFDQLLYKYHPDYFSTRKSLLRKRHDGKVGR
jgi:hypothetical protein